MWKTMDEATLKSKKVAELKEIAKTFGLKGYDKMKKAELVAALMIDETPAKEEAPAAAQPAGEHVGTFRRSRTRKQRGAAGAAVEKRKGAQSPAAIFGHRKRACSSPSAPARQKALAKASAFCNEAFRLRGT